MVDENPKGLGLDHDFILWTLLGKTDAVPIPMSTTQTNQSTNTAANFTRCKGYQPSFQLCRSSIPGKEYGVMATSIISRGVCIGPYEGKLVDIGQIHKYKDRSRMWEVFHGSHVRYFIDGVHTRSWMQFIQCARTNNEQNASVFQCKGRIYYQISRDINVGEEVLVWYDKGYRLYMGIPIINYYNDFKNGDSAERSKSTSSNKATTLDLDELSFNKQESKHGEPLQCMSCYSTITIGSGFKVDHSSLHRNVLNSNNNNSSLHEKAPELNRNICRENENTPYKSSEMDKPCSAYTGPIDRKIEALQCCQCRKTFPQRAMLQTHVCTSQTNTPFHCGQCSLSFSNPSDLRRHVMSHVGERPFKCGFCALSFVGATTLNNHIQIHLGQKLIIKE